MGDRTDAGLTIFDCPESEVLTIVKLIEEYNLAEDWDVYPAPPMTELKLGEPYVAHETYCGAATQIAEWLAAHAPGTTFEVYEDGYAYWSGDVHRHNPGLGSWSADCTDASPHFDADWVWANRNKPNLETLLGITHAKVLATWKAINEGKVLPVTRECKECEQEVEDTDVHAGHGMCGSCVHDATRSGWTPGD